MKPVINWINCPGKSFDTQNHNAMEAYGNYVANLEDKKTLAELKLSDDYIGMLRFVELRVDKVSGRVLDLGAGLGCFSAILSRHGLDELFSLEYSKTLLDKAFPAVLSFMKRRFGGLNSSVISRIWGDFNDLKFEENFIDFIFANHSLHHSYQPEKTLSEALRVLKPGGYMVIMERSLPNNSTDEEIELRKKVELGRRHKTAYGVPVEKTLTRSDMGEHDWREKEWEDFFFSVGFKLINSIRTYKYNNRYFHFLGRRFFNFLYTDKKIKKQLLKRQKVTFYRYFSRSNKNIVMFILQKLQ